MVDSIYSRRHCPYLDPPYTKYPLFGTIYPYLRVQGGSWYSVVSSSLDSQPQVAKSIWGLGCMGFRVHIRLPF